MYSQSKI